MQPLSMTVLRRNVTQWLRRVENGEELLEYGLLIALVPTVALSAVASIDGTIVSVVWDSIASNF